MKKCIACRKRKALSHFYLSKYEIDGFWRECIECCKNGNAARMERLRKGKKKDRQPSYTTMTCRLCGSPTQVFIGTSSEDAVCLSDCNITETFE